MEQECRCRLIVTDGPSKGICAIPRSRIDPRIFNFKFKFESPNGEETRKTISFEVTSPEISGGFEIKGVTEDGIQIMGTYYPPDFDYILFNKKLVARNGSFIPFSQFNPF